MRSSTSGGIVNTSRSVSSESAPPPLPLRSMIGLPLRQRMFADSTRLSMAQSVRADRNDRNEGDLDHDRELSSTLNSLSSVLDTLTSSLEGRGSMDRIDSLIQSIDDSASVLQQHRQRFQTNAVPSTVSAPTSAHTLIPPPESVDVERELSSSMLQPLLPNNSFRSSSIDGLEQLESVSALDSSSDGSSREHSPIDPSWEFDSTSH